MAIQTVPHAPGNVQISADLLVNEVLKVTAPGSTEPFLYTCPRSILSPSDSRVVEAVRSLKSLGIDAIAGVESDLATWWKPLVQIEGDLDMVVIYGNQDIHKIGAGGVLGRLPWGIEG